MPKRSSKPSPELEWRFRLIRDLVDEGPDANLDRWTQNLGAGLLMAPVWREIWRRETPTPALHAETPTPAPLRWQSPAMTNVYAQVSGTTEGGEQARAIRDYIRQGLAEFRAGRPFIRPAPIRDAICWLPEQRAVVRIVPQEGTDALYAQQVALTAVFELLIEAAPWLRVCAREGCGNLFLESRRGQRYCGASCAARVRMARFLAGKQAGAGRRAGRATPKEGKPQPSKGSRARGRSRTHGRPKGK